MNNIKYLIKRVLFRVLFLKKFREFMVLYIEKRALNDSDIDKMIRCCNIVKKCGFNYRLTDGTVLGLYREKGFIKHDDDIDIDIVNANIEQIKILKKQLNMRIGREVVYKKKIQQIAFYDEDGYIFDVVFWYGNEKLIYNYCERDYERIQDAKYFQKDKLEFIEFSGEKYPIPTPIEEWLEMRYGNDWRTPKTYKGDWKEECFDMKRIK